MYQIGDYVVKPSIGLCRVSDILRLDKLSENKDKLYYLLIPLSDERAKIYVPTESTANCLRKPLNTDEAWSIIRNIPHISAVDIDNERQRELKYKEAIRSCNPNAWISIIKTMYLRRQKRNAQGKKSTLMDERYFRLAEDYLYSELAFAIGKPKKEIPQLIANTIE